MPETFMSIVVPSNATLAKYGGNVERWKQIVRRQRGKCGACGTLPPSRKLNLDHQHVKGWKTMLPLDRWQYVRGLLCYMCNHYRVARGATPENLRGAADYLERYLKRRKK